MLLLLLLSLSLSLSLSLLLLLLLLSLSSLSSLSLSLSSLLLLLFTSCMCLRFSLWLCLLYFSEYSCLANSISPALMDADLMPTFALICTNYYICLIEGTSIIRGIDTYCRTSAYECKFSHAVMEGTGASTSFLATSLFL